MELEKIIYFREKKPPTLKQFVIRKAIGESASKTKNVKGKDVISGHPAPKSAKIISENVRGKTAEDLIKEHPEWVEEYKKKYGGER